jgi:hypothetical protein
VQVRGHDVAAVLDVEDTDVPCPGQSAELIGCSNDIEEVPTPERVRAGHGHEGDPLQRRNLVQLELCLDFRSQPKAGRPLAQEDHGQHAIRRQHQTQAWIRQLWQQRQGAPVRTIDKVTMQVRAPHHQYHRAGQRADLDLQRNVSLLRQQVTQGIAPRVDRNQVTPLQHEALENRAASHQTTDPVAGPLEGIEGDFE